MLGTITGPMSLGSHVSFGDKTLLETAKLAGIDPPDGLLQVTDHIGTVQCVTAAAPRAPLPTRRVRGGGAWSAPLSEKLVDRSHSDGLADPCG